MKNFRCFVKVSSVLQPTNKVKEMLIKNLETFDGTLFETEESAKNEIDQRFHKTIKQYITGGGKAMLPKKNIYDTGSGFGFNAGDVIFLHGYAVKKYVLDKKADNPEIATLIKDIHLDPSLRPEPKRRQDIITSYETKDIKE